MDDVIIVRFFPPGSRHLTRREARLCTYRSAERKSANKLIVSAELACSDSWIVYIQGVRGC